MKEVLENFKRAVLSLQRASKFPLKSEIEIAGFIKLYELSYETCWKFLKKKLEAFGRVSTGPRDVFEKAYKDQLIDDPEAWLEMINDRNISVHVYDFHEARELVARILSRHLGLLKKVLKTAGKKH